MSGHGEVVLLIHGFNNVKKAALRSYNGVFTRTFRKTGHIFWPGEISVAATPLVGSAISATSYPFQIEHACQAADRLASFFRSVVGPNGQPVLVTLIAHSLGSRLVFEVLRSLVNNPAKNIRFRLICLMAAALPVKLVQPNSFHLSTNRGSNPRFCVFHSVCDGVLLLAFRSGQYVAWKLGKEAEYYADAVGRHGMPFLSGERCHHEGAAHGDYWPSKKIAGEIALQLGIAKRRILPSRLASGRKSLLRRLTPSRYLN